MIRLFWLAFVFQRAEDKRDGFKKRGYDGKDEVEGNLDEPPHKEPYRQEYSHDYVFLWLSVP